MKKLILVLHIVLGATLLVSCANYGPKLVWKFDDPLASKPTTNNSLYVASLLESKPTIHGNLFIASTGKSIISLDVSNGYKMWDYKSMFNLGGPVVLNERVYFRLGEKHLNCLNLSNGKELWSKRFADGVEPLVVSKRLLLVGRDITCVDPKDFSVVWSYKQEPVNGYFSDLRIAFASDDKLLIHLSNTGGQIICLDTKTGKAVWQSEFVPETPGEKLGATTQGGFVFITSHNIMCLNSKTGEKLWETAEIDEFLVNPYSDGNRIFVVKDGRVSLQIVAYKISDGSLAWEGEVLQKTILEFTINKDKLYYGRADSLVCLESQTGKLLYRYPTEGAPGKIFATNDGKILFQTSKGIIYCLGER